MRSFCSVLLPVLISIAGAMGILAFPVTSLARTASSGLQQEGYQKDESGDQGGGSKPPASDRVTESTRDAAAATPAKGEEGTEKTVQIGDGNTTPFKVGRIVFPTYDFKMANKRLFYGLYLPQDFDESKTYPLVVVLHGLGGSPGQILAYPGLTKYADREGYILVAPMGYNARGWYGSRGKGGGRGSDPRNLGELSEQDVLEVLKLTRRNFQIDPDRIYLFGHSMGGGGSMHLAMTYPKIWAAMAVIAPAAYGSRDRLAKAKDIPAYVVQGDQDRLVSVRQTRLWVDKMKELGMKHEYIEVKNGGHVFLAWQHFDGIFSFFAGNTKSKQPTLPK